MPEQTRIALVTGGSRGLGRSTVLALAARGVSSILTYNTNKDAADEVVALADKAGVKAVALRLDTGDTGAFPGFVEEIRRALGEWRVERFDYLINNAGNSHAGAITDITEDDLDELYRIHVKGVLFLTQALLPIINDGGRIVNISSGLTRIIYPGGPPMER